jgi:hypothetical protein
MAKKKVKVWLTQFYTKQVRMEVEVDDSLDGEELWKQVNEDKEIQKELQERIIVSTMYIEDEVLEVIE